MKHFRNLDNVCYFSTKILKIISIIDLILPKDFERFDEWRFWDGKAWVGEMGAAADITNHVSNELSVSPLPDGRYALFF